jgi:hypothetical protein
VTTPDKKIKCGVIMPISAMDGYPSEHWKNVQEILFESIESAGFEPDLVSNSDEVNVIQKTIVQNIYNNEIIVCDISARNANVMFELGMRLTFDKPTVIVKDDETPTPFDTSIIEYIPYRKDLRYGDIQTFKGKLSSKIISTHRKGEKADYSPFIKNFGPFKIPKIDEEEVEPIEYLIERIEALRHEVKLTMFEQKETFYTHLNRIVEGRVPLRVDVVAKLRNFLASKKEWATDHNNPSSLIDVLESEFYNIYPDAKIVRNAVRKEIISFLRIIGHKIEGTESTTMDSADYKSWYL